MAFAVAVTEVVVQVNIVLVLEIFITGLGFIVTLILTILSQPFTAE